MVIHSTGEFKMCSRRKLTAHGDVESEGKEKNNP